MSIRDRIKWVVSRDLIEVNKEIVSKFNLSMEEYLIPVFSGKEITKKPKFTQGLEFETLEELLRYKNNDGEKQLIKEAIKIHRNLQDIDRSPTLDINPSELVDQCIISLSSLIH